MFSHLKIAGHYGIKKTHAGGNWHARLPEKQSITMAYKVLMCWLSVIYIKFPRIFKKYTDV